MAAKGNEITRAWIERLTEEKLSQRIISKCNHCSTWRAEGELRETKALYREHLADKHPEVEVVPHRKKRSHMPRIAGKKSLDENIANARSQGGAAWAGPLEADL